MNKSIQRVVELIQSQLAEGELVWHKPYISAYQANLVSNNEYHGINRLMTALIGHKRGYTSPFWATFKQIATLGGTLVEAKGQGIPIIFYKDLTSSNDDQDDEKQKRRFVLRHSMVFNLDLVEGLEAVNQDPGQSHFDVHAESEDLVMDYLERESVRLSMNPLSTPAYAPAIDTVFSPGIRQFCSQDEYYSTVFHELAYSTGHPKRLARFELNQATFGSKEDYSKEELVAEFAAAMLCHHCKVDSQASIKNSAAYIQGWSRFIKDNEQAFDYIRRNDAALDATSDQAA